ncbi:MFS general substrate transporter [Mycena rebaudengoi]|nr:MFS general substrate transporter [Mycena rebaudengoi]
MSTPSPASGRSALHSIAIVAVCTSAMVVTNAANSSVSVTLHTIGDELHVTEAYLQWLVSAYPLSSGCLLLFFGRLADLYGRKRALVSGCAILTAFTLACGFAKDELSLAVLRGLQGVGGAAVIPASVGILAHSFPSSPSRPRAIAFATFSAGAPIGSALGMVLGGILTQLSRYTWRAQFFLSTALSFATLLGAVAAIDSDRPLFRRSASSSTGDVAELSHDEPEDRRLDWLGALLSTSGLIFIIFCLGQGEIAHPGHGGQVTSGWGEAYIITLLVAGVLLLLLFAAWELRLERVHFPSAPTTPDALEKSTGDESHIALQPSLRNSSGASNSGAGGIAYRCRTYMPPPLLRPRLFARARGRVGVMYMIALLQFAVFMGWYVWAQLYYESYMGYSPIRTIVRLMPMFICGLCCNAVVVLIVERVQLVWLLASGTLASALAPLLFAVIDPRASYWAFGFPAACLSVVGMDFVFAAGTLFIAGVSSPDEQSVAGGVFQTMTQLGTSIGVTVSTIVFNRLKQHTLQTGPDTLIAYRGAMWSACVFGIAATVLGLVFFRGVGTVGSSKTKKTDGYVQN